MHFFDTHAHLDDEQFSAGLSQIIRRAREAGVANVLAIGTTVDSSQTTLRISRRMDGVFAAVGIQPNYCAAAKPGDWEQIVRLASEPAVVAIGETGLDRYWDHTPWDVQLDYFERHVALSRQIDKPFVVHMRDCQAEMLTFLQAASQQGPLRGVMHSFTGDASMAEQCAALGLYISFAGMVTFKKSDELRSVAATVPDDRILIETDSPYLSPHPKRGQRPNEPALVVHTAACLAQVRGVPIEEFAEQTRQNARTLFRLNDE